MKKGILIFSILSLAMLSAIDVNAGENEQSVQTVLDSYVPAHTSFARPKVDKVTINDKKKTIDISLTESAAYIPLTTKQVGEFKRAALASLPDKYTKYKITINVGKRTLDALAIDAKRANYGPKETTPFVTPLERVAAPKGLDGSNIALWQSHGWYFEPKLSRWEWQRARLFQTVEDLYTQSYVMPFLMPMLQNAGAYVMSPRERDVRAEEIIIDNDTRHSDNTGYRDHDGHNKWAKAPNPGFGHDGSVLTEGVNPFRNGTARMVNGATEHRGLATATWSAKIPKDGEYAVYVSYQSLPNSAPDVIYTINAANGPHRFKVNQKMGGGTWIYLGHFPFESGLSDEPLVELSNATDHSGSVITADAVKIGGGIGNVARIVKNQTEDIDYEYVISRYPRFTEGARYFLQWAGAPDSVYTPTDNENDYNDDYRSRGLWVNWLAGGSSMLPQQRGLGIPVDLSFAFHTDAGITPDDSIIGTLGIYCTESKDDKYANGTSRLAARDLTNSIMTQIVEDVRSEYEPNWTRRGMWDKSYAEARVPQVPAMLLELLSHQNFADMKYGLDPTFRFTVSRAVYKGMLKYIAARDNREYVVQPLPISNFAISGANGQYQLQWTETVDALEPTATPTYYIVEERKGDEIAFTPIAIVDGPSYQVRTDDSAIHSYRIIAGNDGGTSFPSEVLALCDKPGTEQVLIVNGFTRVSAPDWFDSGEIAGFYDVSDHGVAYMHDISFIGSQFEFRRDVPWRDDDAAGFGASHSNYETKVFAGNTFDYVAIHGQAIAQAGHGFISASVGAFASASYQPTAKIVDLIMGKQKEVQLGSGACGTRYKTFPAELQARLGSYAKGGGNIFVSGSYIATDLWNNPYSDKSVAEEDQKFATSVLGYRWRVGQASVTGKAYEVPSKFKAFGPGQYEFFNDLNPEMYAIESPDSFFAADKNGATIMRYNENNLVAATAYAPSTHRAVAMGFPFETIKDSDQRAALMQQVLKFLSH